MQVADTFGPRMAYLEDGPNGPGLRMDLADGFMTVLNSRFDIKGREHK